MKHFARFVALTALTVGGPAVAAPVTSPPARPILVKTLEPCETNCEWIALQGTIDKQTLAEFAKIVKGLGRARPPVFLNSGGGDVASAMAIGRLIRAHGLDTALAATTLDDEKAKPSRLASPGRMTTRRAFCASACSFLLAAGTRRYVAYDSLVGLHEMVRPEQDVPQKVLYYQTRTWTRDGRVERRETHLVGEKSFLRHFSRQKSPESAYRDAANYFAKMGVAAEECVTIMKSAAPEKMAWLAPFQLNETRLATERKSADALLGITRPIVAAKASPQLLRLSSAAAPTAAAPVFVAGPQEPTENRSPTLMLGGIVALGVSGVALALRGKRGA